MTDISDINQRLGKKGVLDVLSSAKKIKESIDKVGEK